jgi:thymidylate kinase
MLLISVVGAAPGIGKSSVCASLAEWLSAGGRRVDHFQEEQVLTRPRFARVAADFASTGVVEPRVLVDATVHHLNDAAAEGVEVALVDSLIPYMPSLLAFGHDEASIAGIVTTLSARIAAFPTLVVYLDGDPAVALHRAAARDGQKWLSAYADKLARYGLVAEGADAEALRAYLDTERAITLRILRRQPWELAVVADADRGSPDEVFTAVRAAVTRFVYG